MTYGFFNISLVEFGVQSHISLQQFVKRSKQSIKRIFFQTQQSECIASNNNVSRAHIIRNECSLAEVLPTVILHHSSGILGAI